MAYECCIKIDFKKSELPLEFNLKLLSLTFESNTTPHENVIKQVNSEIPLGLQDPVGRRHLDHPVQRKSTEQFANSKQIASEHNMSK